MNQSELEQKFEKEMLANIAQAESLGCPQKKLKQSIERYGAAAAMENLIRRRQLSEGYACLEKLGRLDLSAEALTVKALTVNYSPTKRLIFALMFSARASFINKFGNIIMIKHLFIGKRCFL